jgi:hypothetical protein
MGAGKGVKMTLAEIKKRLAVIEANKHDDEVAHDLEDKLWEDVLVEISRDKSTLGKLAKEALKSRDIKFSRWTS